MKKLLLFSLLGGLSAQFAMGVATNPVGYSTQTIYNGVFNLVGITLQGTTVAAGATVSVNGAVVTVVDGIADGLGSGPYIFEVTSGTLNGAIELISASDSTLNTLTLANALTSLAATDTYVIRNAATLGSVFGTGANVLIKKGTSLTGDLVYVPVGGGAFNVYYHTADSFVAGAWTKDGGGGLGANTPLVYTDAVYVLNRSGANYNLVITGEVKTTPTIIGLPDAFNYISAVYPVGTTLAGSGIANSSGFLKGTSTTGDLIYMSDVNNPGTYRIFYHTADSFVAGTWREDGVSGDAGSVTMTSGIVIQRRAGSAYNAGIAVPPSWVIE